MDFYSAIKKNEIMPCAATWIDLEIVILSEVNQTEEKYNVTSLMCGIYKDDTKELIYKIETDSQTQKRKLWLPKGDVVCGDKLRVWD